MKTDELERVMEELGSKPSYAYGERRLPQPISNDDGAAVVGVLAGEVDKGVRERARLAGKQRLQIHCREGCTACCDIPVMVYRPESLRVANWLLRDENKEARAQFAANYSRWKSSLSDVLPVLEERSAAYRDQAPYFDLLIEATRRAVRCALNHEGRCLAYEQRPLGCRNAHALDTDAHCGSNDRTGQPAVAVSFAPLDELMVGSARLLRAVHNQMEHVERHRAEALCQAVARLIGLD